MIQTNKEFILGVKKTIPLIIGVLPFGLSYGIVASQSGLSLVEITFMSMFVFAGASQFMAITMLKQGLAFSFIIFSTLLINLRHLLMGLSLSPYLNKQKPIWLYLLSFGMVDESYATTINHYQSSGLKQGNPYFMLGAGTGMYLSWVISSFVGGILGHAIKDPLSWGLDFAMPATFLCILIPQIKSWRMFSVIVTSGVTAVAANILIPGKWYIIIATVTATIVGTSLEIKAESRRAKCELNTSF